MEKYKIAKIKKLNKRKLLIVSTSFPVELQIWNQKDALLNFYTHGIIYKANRDFTSKKYGLSLRKWLDVIPNVPNGVEVGYIKYLYEIVYASQKGE